MGHSVVPVPAPSKNASYSMGLRGLCGGEVGKAGLNAENVLIVC